jgi:hypothetical protein
VPLQDSATPCRHPPDCDTVLAAWRAEDGTPGEKWETGGRRRPKAERTTQQSITPEAIQVNVREIQRDSVPRQLSIRRVPHECYVSGSNPTTCIRLHL